MLSSDRTTTRPGDRSRGTSRATFPRRSRPGPRPRLSRRWRTWPEDRREDGSPRPARPRGDVLWMVFRGSQAWRPSFPSTLGGVNGLLGSKEGLILLVKRDEHTIGRHHLESSDVGQNSRFASFDPLEERCQSPYIWDRSESISPGR